MSLMQGRWSEELKPNTHKYCSVVFIVLQESLLNPLDAEKGSRF